MPVIFVLAAFLGAPLFAVIAATALNGFHAGGMAMAIVVLEFNRIVDTPVLISIPLFAFAGYLLGETKAPQRLVAVVRAALGWMPGGLAVVTLAVCAVFTAFTGASGVTIIALGSLLYPALLREGYSEKFGLGLITTSGSLGVLFPPAIPLILYGIISQSSIDKLFAAGILPGVFMVAALSIFSLVRSRGRVPVTEFEAGKFVTAVRDAAWELPLPFILLGGIYSGILAVSEAAALTAVYVLFVETVIYREVTLGSVPLVMRKSMTLVGGILIILGMSLASSNYLIDQEIPTRLFTFVQAHISSKWSFLMVLNVFLLILGCILDIFAAIVLVVPLLLPIAVSYGIDPIHLGIIFLANMQIGYCTPPVGMNLFIASYRFEKPIVSIYLATLPFIAILLAVVLVITYWPHLSLFLTQFVG